jgi:hypothetical protein
MLENVSSILNLGCFSTDVVIRSEFVKRHENMSLATLNCWCFAEGPTLLGVCRDANLTITSERKDYTLAALFNQHAKEVTEKRIGFKVV